MCFLQWVACTDPPGSGAVALSCHLAYSSYKCCSRKCFRAISSFTDCVAFNELRFWYPRVTLCFSFLFLYKTLSFRFLCADQVKRGVASPSWSALFPAIFAQPVLRQPGLTGFHRVTPDTTQVLYFVATGCLTSEFETNYFNHIVGLSSMA